MDDLVEAIEHPKSVQKQASRVGKIDRIGVLGRNKVTVIYEVGTYIIVTVYNYRKAYNLAKSKHRRNKNRLNLKRQLGNRLKK